MQELVKDGMEVYEDTQKMRWGKKMRADGWYEWVNNKDLKDLLEDVYQVKESFKALAMSRMVRRNNKLGMATLKDKHFQKMWGMLKDDLDVKSLDELCAKAKACLMKMAVRCAKNPVHQKMQRQVIRLIKTIERTRKVWDVPSKRAVESWVEEEGFQPWN